MKSGLDKIVLEIKDLLPYLEKYYQVKSIEIFGSYVRNEQKNDSDLDLLVSFTETPSLIKFVALKNYLSDRLHVNVDLVMKDALKPTLSKNILNEAISV